MPWIKTEDINPPLTPSELGEIAKGYSIARETPEGVLVGGSKVITGPNLQGKSPRTGLGITYGPNGELFYLHLNARLDIKTEGTA